MKFVVAPDSFKGCMSAKRAAEAIRDGLSRVFPDAEYALVPMADGGEGTVQALVDATGGVLRTATVLGPLQRPVNAAYGLLGNLGDLENEPIGLKTGDSAGGAADGHATVPECTAVIEMAAASGIQFVDDHTRNPLETTTFGTGQLIRRALDDGARTIMLGLGGSATNDGGAGMAEALGVRFLDGAGNPIPRGGGHLDRLERIDMSGLDPRLAGTRMIIASDVTNPLIGPNGASAVFGPQKGATPQMVARLDANLAHYAQVVERATGLDVAHVPGSGAAGGLGAGLLAFTGATMRAGVEVVADAARLAARAADADWCFTGEGGIDAQTQYGKTPVGVARAVHDGNPRIRVVALAGHVGDGIEELYDMGIDAIFGIVPGTMTLDKALADGPENLARTAENVARLIRARAGGGR